MTQEVEARAEVADAYRRQLDAMVTGDVDTLNELLADDYTARHITGYEQPKAEWLAQIRDGHFVYHRIDQQSLDIRVDGDTATLTSRALMSVTIGGGTGRWPLRSTQSFERRAGSWVATHSSSSTY